MSPSSNLRIVSGAPAGGTAASDGAPDDDDLRLVERSVGGDMQAWGRLYQLYFHRLYQHICYLTGTPTSAEDLTQETFARALSSLGTFGGRSRLSTWLHGIAINVVRKHRDATRKVDATRQRLTAVREAVPLAGDLERRHLQRTRAQALCRILDELPDHLREAFVLRDLQGLEVAEAAAQLGVTEANLRVRAHRARVRVHDVLVQEGWIEPASPTEPTNKGGGR